jgi:hypothetical protein
VHAPHVPPSIRHWNVEPPSLELKVKAADVEAVGSVGFEPIVVWGGVVSIVNVRLVGVWTFAATSVARTRTV